MVVLETNRGQALFQRGDGFAGVNPAQPSPNDFRQVICAHIVRWPRAVGRRWRQKKILVGGSLRFSTVAIRICWASTSRAMASPGMTSGLSRSWSPNRPSRGTDRFLSATCERINFLVEIPTAQSGLPFAGIGRALLVHEGAGRKREHKRLLINFSG